MFFEKFFQAIHLRGSLRWFLCLSALVMLFVSLTVTVPGTLAAGASEFNSSNSARLHGASAAITGRSNIHRSSGPHFFRLKGAPAPKLGSGNLQYFGGPIQKYPKVYITFWDWSSDPYSEAPYLENFLAGVGGSSWLNTVTQYNDTSRGYVTSPSNQLLGTWNDTVDPAPTQPTQSQLAQEALVSAAHFGYNPDATYFIATATGKSSAGFGSQYCAWHNVIWNQSDPVEYTDFPYIPDAGGECGMNDVNPGPAGYLDGVSIVAGHELAEAQTDPQLNAWADWDGYEIGDKCEWINLQNITLPTGTFAIQPLWSNASGSCVASYSVSTYGFDESPIPTASSWASSIVEGSDNNAWFTEFNGNKIGRATIVPGQGVTALTEFPIPTAGSGPQGITSGPDGNLWFTEFNGNKIGRITPSGTITEFPIPTVNSEPASITSDGTNLWFTEFKGNKIGEITTTGAITEYVIPTANSGPLGITYRGQPSNSVTRIWFTEYNASKIGHTQVQAQCSGVPPHIHCVFVTKIFDSPLPSANSEPYGITTAYDGATLWFTEYAANKVGEIASDGSLTEYTLPTVNSEPMGISAFSLGASFAEFNGNKIGLVNINGPSEPGVSDIPVPTANSGPMDTYGEWFIEAVANKVGDFYA
ncbi:MAG TPA: hypothetical protein VFA09_24610 [Ktedonobacteraceae bacterium]|nr:hypothetical protein [Ktedonobacteraceae bacterium]